MIRFALILIYIVLVLVPIGLPLLPVFWLIRLCSPKFCDRLTYPLVRFFANGVGFLAGMKLKTEYEEELPKGEAFLFVANHRSFFDEFAAFEALDRPFAFVSKAEYRKIPSMNSWMKLLHCVFVDRGNLRDGLRSVEEIETGLKNGYSFWIHPEGTRSQKDQMLPFHEGSFRPAFRTGTRIVPVTIVRTDDLFEKHEPKVRPARVTLHFGKPVATEGLDRVQQRALIAQIHAGIQSGYERLIASGQ